MTKRSILIGNGLNRCYDDEISWSNLLDDMANKYDVDYDYRNPLPIEFERIINQILIKNPALGVDIYNEIKLDI